MDVIGCYVYVNLFDAVTNAYVTNLSGGVWPQTSWNLATVGSWTADDRAAVDVRVLVACFGGVGNTVYFDDITLY